MLVVVAGCRRAAFLTRSLGFADTAHLRTPACVPGASWNACAGCGLGGRATHTPPISKERALTAALGSSPINRSLTRRDHRATNETEHVIPYTGVTLHGWKGRAAFRNVMYALRTESSDHLSRIVVIRRGAPRHSHEQASLLYNVMGYFVGGEEEKVRERAAPLAAATMMFRLHFVTRDHQPSEASSFLGEAGIMP